MKKRSNHSVNTNKEIAEMCRNNGIFRNAGRRAKFILIFSLLFIILLSSSISAIGITPGKTNLEYKPGSTERVSFSVINSEARDINVVILVQGELNRSIAVSEVSFSMKANEERRELSYTIEIPLGLSPGPHKAEIVALQLPGKSQVGEAFIGAAVGVATQAEIFVPYPGKYAEIDLSVLGPDNDGNVIFVVPVHSRGKLDIKRVRAGIDVYSSLNEKVASLGTNEFSLSGGERRELTAPWDTKDVLPGPYRAVANVLYDESSARAEKEFSVGRRVLELQSIEVNDFSLGGIAKFEALVENKWSERINGAYGQMLVYNNDGEVMADFKSQTYDIEPLSKALMAAFWDTEGVRAGTYASSFFLKYADQSIQKDLQLEVSEDSINVIGLGYVISKGGTRGRLGGIGDSLIVVLVTIIGVLIIVNALWFLYLRKRLLGRSAGRARHATIRK